MFRKPHHAAVARAVVLVTAFIAADVAAAEQKGVALFPLIVAKGTNPQIAAALDAALRAAAEDATGITILDGDALEAKLRSKPARVVNKCERRRRFAACFARVAAKLGVDDLLLARTATKDGTTRLMVLAIKPTNYVARCVTQFALILGSKARRALASSKLREAVSLISGRPPSVGF